MSTALLPLLPCVPADPTAPRAFSGGSPAGGKAAGPSHLDRLLAELGDTHYPRSCEPLLLALAGEALA